MFFFFPVLSETLKSRIISDTHKFSPGRRVYLPIYYTDYFCASIRLNNHYYNETKKEQHSIKLN